MAWKMAPYVATLANKNENYLTQIGIQTDSKATVFFFRILYNSTSDFK